jgi:N-acetylglutamate synthase-like GNAT family acetyltransferase
LFITKASRHDKSDIKEFLEKEWPDSSFNVDRGTAFIAREGAVLGHARLIEVAPQTLVVEEVVVQDGRRREGIGTRLIEAAMNNKGGKLFLCCHEEQIPFYEKFGFSGLAFDDLPDEVQQFHRDEGDYPTRQGHQHFFMTAR